MKQKVITNQRQTGAVAVTVAISIVVLIGFVGLALDLGRLFITKSELQNSADACALAAARELTGVSNTQLTIAKAAGMTIGTAHNVMFQSEPVSDISITFGVDQYAQDNEAFEGETAKNMEYVRCSTRRRGIATWLIQILNILPGVDIGEQVVSASAVATLTNAQNNCAIPVGICEADLETAGGVNGAKGEWLEGTLSEGMTGSFKWIDFSPPNGGASELAELLKGAGMCNVPSTGAYVGESGFVASLADTWNTRFGVYKNKPTQAGSVPDFTGYAYTEVTTPSKFGVYDDFKNQRKVNAPYQTNDETGLNVKGSIDGSAELEANGADRRLAAVPIVDCDNFIDGQTAEIKEWGCVLMLHPINDNASSKNPVRMYLEYLGLASDPDSPCATLGVPGDSSSIGPQVPVLVK